MKRFSLLAALAAAAAVAVPATAGAQIYSASDAYTVGNAHYGKTRTDAYIRVHYRCSTGNELWVSLKQAKGRKKDPALAQEGSSAASVAWLDSHRNTVKCDGKWHTKKFTVDKVEPGKKGVLKRGYAWMQFCLGKQGDQNLEISKAGWVKVRR